MKTILEGQDFLTGHKKNWLKGENDKFEYMIKNFVH